ncbi:hypothetical protein IFM89_021531, partial [Coptis chinensis]
RLELKLSHISLSSTQPNKTFNLSEVGFFTPRNNRFYGGIKNKSLNIYFYKIDPYVLLDLYFQNCLPELQFSMDIHSATFNIGLKSRQRNYLPAKKNYLFWLYFIYIFTYFFFAVQLFRASLLHRKNSTVTQIHYVIQFFLVFKILSFGIELANLCYTKYIGNAHGFLGLYSGFILRSRYLYLGLSYKYRLVLSCETQNETLGEDISDDWDLY